MTLSNLARPPQRKPSVAAREAEGMAPEDRVEAMHRAIGRAVTEQRLLPGMRLPEDQIGGHFGASRTLVRAALQRLAHDGLVTMSRNRGAFVASPTIDEARHVFDARRIVEGVMVARAVEAIGGPESEALEALLMRGDQAMQRGDRGTAIRLSGEFHLAIGSSANQPVLLGLLTELVSRSSLVIALYGRGYHSACADDEHRHILDALRRKDGIVAGQLMTDHLHHIEADLDLEPRSARSASITEALRSLKA